MCVTLSQNTRRKAGARVTRLNAVGPPPEGGGGGGGGAKGGGGGGGHSKKLEKKVARELTKSDGQNLGQQKDEEES